MCHVDAFPRTGPFMEGSALKAGNNAFKAVSRPTFAQRESTRCKSARAPDADRRREVVFWPYGTLIASKHVADNAWRGYAGTG